MFGFLLYLPSLAYMPHYLVLLAFVYLVITNPKYCWHGITQFVSNPNVKVSTNNFIVFTIVLLSLMNMVFHREKFMEFNDFFPYFILLPITFFMAQTVRPTQWLWLLYFIGFECVIGVFQFAVNEPSFFPELLKFPENYDPTLLYYRRAYGLSTSSSTFANKILLALVLVDYLQLKGKLKWTLYTLFFAGFVVTFNRTVLLVVVFYFAFQYIYHNINIRFKPTRFYLNILFLLMVIVGGGFLVMGYSDAIINQFTRSKGELDISGRDHIWAYFFNFIQSNIFFGNGGFKYYFHNGLHAHNSFIQVVANNGIIISIFYFLLIFKNLTRDNLIPVAALVMYSMSQYGIFWGISVMDILLFYFLTRNSGTIDDAPFLRENKNWWLKLLEPNLLKNAPKN